MPQSAGTRLGPYEILAPIGAGGMGEVYRAKDTRLGREVAVKVSKDEFTERFAREARSIASLNHPNICHLYDVGPSYLVMEYVEGQDLRGPLPLDEALPIINQLIDGIEAAHEKNIVHRDLKPANIKITPEGVVKILDFGLAKAMEPPRESSPENSPTVTIGATQAGTILGTASYMAPEQAKGKQADRRSDIWSFGVIVYEILTGKRPFAGETVVATLGEVMHKEPDWTPVPERMQRLLQRCLQKNRKLRLGAIGDARWMMEESATQAAVAVMPASSSHASGWLGWVAWGLAALGMLATLGFSFVHFREAPPDAPNYEFQIAPPPNTQFATFRLSPDGRAIAFIATGGQVGGSRQGRLFIRTLDSIESHEVQGTDGSSYPFWSPDSAFVAYYQGGKLKKVALKGGPSQTICDALDSRGGAWGSDGTILFSEGPANPILRVPSSGGKPTPVTKVAGNAGPGGGHRAPEFLPDGRHFLFLATSDNAETGGVYVGALDGSPPVRVLADNLNATYSPDQGGRNGNVFFLRDGTLMAIRFDINTLHTMGEPFPIAENVAVAANVSYGAFSSSALGSLAYWSGERNTNRELVWMDLSGKRTGTVGAPRPYGSFVFSPDEKTLAVSQGVTAPQNDIWLIDLGRKNSTRFTFGVGGGNATWAANGASLIYSRRKGVTWDLVRKPITGGSEELILPPTVNAAAADVSPDGKQLAYAMSSAKTGFDIGLLALDGIHQTSVYLATPANERFARFSPDGKWMAYESDESGRFEVYVQTVPAGGAKYQISTAGGSAPAWRRDGKELFYYSLNEKIMSVPVRINATGTTFEPGTPKELFPAPGASSFTVTRDGQRFLVNLRAGGDAAAAPPMTVVTNWRAGLKK